MTKYTGITYIVFWRKGKRHMRLQLDDEERYTDLGADLTLLDFIGDQDPEDVMRLMLKSIPQEEVKK